MTVTGLTTVSGGAYQASTATQTFNAGLTISSGTFTGSSGAVDVNGTLTLSGGTLTAPSGDFTVSGNWANTAGSFTPGSGTVTFDGTGTSTLSGSNLFNSLKSITAGKTLNFTAGTTQTIADTLTLTGASGNLIKLRSTTEGSQWKIDPQGTGSSSRSISFVDVKDSNNISGAAIDPANSTNSGNNTNWWTPAASTTTAGLIEAESILYKRPLLLLQPMTLPALIFVVPVAGTLPVSIPTAITTTQATTPLPPQEAATPLPLPLPPLTPLSVKPKIPKPDAELFSGVYSYTIFPKTKFEGITPTSSLPKPVSPLIFDSVTGEAKVNPVRNMEGAIGKNKISNGVKVMFPDGSRVIPTYDKKLPLGLERIILEPKIDRKGEEEEKKEEIPISNTTNTTK